MKVQYLLVVILALSTAHYTQSKQYDDRIKRSKRQTTNADKMVQNILQWLQGVYTQNSRKIRQGTLREYLPPANTQRPRPFEPGYPPAGSITPQPPFPVFTNPATGAVTAVGYPSAPAGFEPPREGAYPGGGTTTATETAPPAGPREQPQPAGPTGLPAFPTHPDDRPGFPSTFPTGSTLFPAQPPSTGYPSGFPTGFPSLPTGGFPTGRPGFPTQPPTGGYPTDRPGFPTQPPTGGYPGDKPGFPTQPPTGGYPTDRPGFPTQPPTGYPTDRPGFPTQPPPGVQPSTQPPAGETTQAVTTGAPDAQPPVSTGYPTEHNGLPTTAPEVPGPVEGSTQPQYSTGYPPAGQPEAPREAPTTSQPSVSETIPSEGPTPAAPEQPEPSQPPAESTSPPEVPTAPGIVPSTQTPQTEAPSAPGEAPSTVAPAVPSEPTTGDAFTSAPQEPDANTIPGKAATPEEPSGTTAPTGPGEPAPTDDDLNHPPHIHAIDVQCAKDMMTINIEFNRQFDGVIYSKGYYNMPECRYVKENSGQTKYSFTVSLNSCGTEFINAFDTQGQSYLENILVLQNELGIQEVWDTVRSVRCLWEGSLKESLSVSLSVGMLNQEIVTFSGDTAMAKLDINLGRGPFGQPANGLVKIGEPMTLVVSVSGDAGFDVQVKDCRATDSSGDNNVQLTDDNGCVLKPKLFGAFQKTRNTGETGASIITYAYFNAFKFPDVMDLMIECNIELCKTDCEMCSDPNQKLEPAKRRKRDLSGFNNTLTDGGVTMGKHLMVVLPEDLNNQSIESILKPVVKDNVCMSTEHFVLSMGLLISLLASSCTFSVYLWLQKSRKQYLTK